MIAEIGIQCTAISVTTGYETMIKQRNYFFLSLLCGLFVGVTACSTTASDPAEAYKGESGTHIFQAGEDALRDHNYHETIKRFEALDAQYPYGPEAETAQLHIIYAYYMSSDYPSTEAAADRFIHAHPANPNIAYAYYLRGLANYNQDIGVFERVFTVDLATRDLTQVKKAYSDFATIVSRYPHSVYAAPAHQYMVYLRNLLANHQLEVAQYYYSRGAYVAAVNRAAIVVQNYQGAPAVPQALVLMAKSYHQLHDAALENQMITLIRYNYPHSTYLDEVTNQDQASTSVNVAPKQRAEPGVPVTAEAKPATTVEADNVLANPTAGNGSRGGVQPMSLKKMIETADNTGFFSFHPKPQKQTVQPQPQVVAMADQVDQSQQLSQQKSGADTANTTMNVASNAQVMPTPDAPPPPSASSYYPHHANGGR